MHPFVILDMWILKFIFELCSNQLKKYVTLTLQKLLQLQKTPQNSRRKKGTFSTNYFLQKKYVQIIFYKKKLFKLFSKTYFSIQASMVYILLTCYLVDLIFSYFSFFDFVLTSTLKNMAFMPYTSEIFT